MPTKVNIVLDDDVKADLDRLVESGKRSRVVNSALRREIQLMSRRAAGARLDEIRAATRPVSTADVVKLLRRVSGQIVPADLFVPDASVLLKWVLRQEDEPHRDAALELKDAWLDDACELVVPSLWVFEVGNVLGIKHPATATPLMQAMVDLGIREESPHGYFPGILGLMRDHKVTFYDAAYHALAVRHRGTMITDRAYVARTARAGHVALLSDWRAR